MVDTSTAAPQVSPDELLILNSSRDCIKILDLEGNLLSMSIGGQRLLEVKDITPYLGKSWVDLMEGVHRQHAAEAVICARNGGVGIFQAYLPTITGKPKWWDVILTPILGPEGRPQRLLGISRDITQQKQADEALRQSEQRYRTLVELSPDGLALVDFDGSIVECNEQAPRQLGYTHEEFTRLKVADVDALDSPAEVQARMERMLRTGKERFETQHRTKDGQLRDVIVSVNRVDFGSTPYFLCVWHDITERKQMEQQLQQAKAAADAASQAKDHFLAVLSHELRTPLTPVLTMVQMMERDSKTPPPMQEAISMIRRNIELEARLVDDLLDLNRILRGKLELHFTSVDLHEKVWQVAQICDNDLRSKQLRLTLELRAEQHHLRADAARLQQVLWNLLKNAVKFTPAGGEVVIRTDNPGEGQAAVVVKDTGVGIEPEKLARLFDAFEQGGRNVTRQFGGLGLGLSISRGIADLHGGRLLAASGGRGKGATFTLVLQTSAAVPAAEPSASLGQDQSQASRGGRLLLVEDHADTAKAMRLLLESYGYEVRIATSVASALQAAQAETFELLISDIGLPDGSGLDLMRQLQARHPIKGIAVSGYGMEEDVRKSKEAGFAAHLTKPINFQELERILGKVCG